jgi:ribosomal protein L2
MQWMKSRQWVLEPHVISVENDLAKANIFKIPDGYSIPVVYGESDRVRVRLSNIHDLNSQTTCLAYHPGKERPVAVNLSKAGKDWYIDVPLERGCAMIKLTTK